MEDAADGGVGGVSSCCLCIPQLAKQALVEIKLCKKRQNIKCTAAFCARARSEAAAAYQLVNGSEDGRQLASAQHWAVGAC